MSSLPTHLSARRGHSHKRSAAISGDFDVNYGLNIFQPPTPISMKLTPKNSDSSIDYNVDRNFKFNNEKDFENVDEFNFPSEESLSKNFKYSLNSPIRLNNLYSNSSLNLNLNSMSSNSTLNSNKYGTSTLTTASNKITNKNKFIIPDPLIDLDEIFNKNHRRTESAPELEFLPKIESMNSKFKSSFNFKKNQFNSPKEVDLNEFNEINEILEEDEGENEENQNQNEDLHEDYNDHEVFKHSKKLYNNASQNSSTLSFITTSNNPNFLQTHSSDQSLNSNNSNNSNLNSNNNSNTHLSTSTTSHITNNFNTIDSIPILNKRTGAHANRYQLFYDNSYKISNALKSSESINIPPKLAKNFSLEHSCSLPILKNKKGHGASHLIDDELQDIGINNDNDNYGFQARNDIDNDNESKESENSNDNSVIVTSQNGSPNSVSTHGDDLSRRELLNKSSIIQSNSDLNHEMNRIPVSDDIDYNNISKPIIKINSHLMDDTKDFNCNYPLNAVTENDVLNPVSEPNEFTKSKDFNFETMDRDQIQTQIQNETGNVKLNDCLKILKVTKIPNFKHRKSNSFNYFRNFNQSDKPENDQHSFHLNVDGRNSKNDEFKDNLSLRSLNWSSDSKKSKFMKWFKKK